MMNLAACLLHLRFGEEFACGETYDSIQWLSNTQKPTEAQVLAAWNQIKESELWKPIRIKRDSLLAECDWTQLSDSSANKEAWTSYRQALREIPQTYQSPDEVVWPTKP
jgi:hypothetical protein